MNFLTQVVLPASVGASRRVCGVWCPLCVVLFFESLYPYLPQSTIWLPRGPVWRLSSGVCYVLSCLSSVYILIIQRFGSRVVPGILMLSMFSNL